MCSITIMYWILVALILVLSGGLTYFALRCQRLESELIKAHEAHLINLLSMKGQLNEGV